MKRVMARTTRKHFVAICLALLSAFYLGSTAWPYSAAQKQNCSVNCESHERLAALTHSKTLDARTVIFMPADGTSVSAVLTSADVEPAAAGSIPSNTDPGATSAQALTDPVTEGSTPGPRFFLLIGLALIGVRLIISYRSRKVKNLATGAH
jgi:hypothetical protein